MVVESVFSVASASFGSTTLEKSKLPCCCGCRCRDGVLEDVVVVVGCCFWLLVVLLDRRAARVCFFQSLSTVLS